MASMRTHMTILRLPCYLSGASRAADAVSSAPAAVSSSSPIISTQPTPTPPRQEEDSTTAHTPPLPERPIVDEFTDPKIAPLHAIFPRRALASLCRPSSRFSSTGDHDSLSSRWSPMATLSCNGTFEFWR
ncbi:hypothetical protein BJV74DRAFT_550795 [Russula compacta]|nr:hypothetical protein BJV74DRAFT_550795 [Russula compacta]